MRNGFEEYYQPTEDEFLQLWSTAEIVLDTNVLLNLYRYSEETRNILLDILDAFEDQLWLPHQAALEYHRRRPDVIYDQRRIYEAVIASIGSVPEKMREDLKEFVARKHHPVLDLTDFLARIGTELETFAEEVETLRFDHPNWITKDPIRDYLDILYEGRVGEAFRDERLAELYKSGAKRYEKQVPPGYEDARKGDNSQYGDLLLWSQILDRAKETGRPIILVTDDRKEDWWWRSKGRIIGPRFELTREIRDYAGVDFYMYPADRFLEQAISHLERQTPTEAIEEIRDVRRREEERQDQPSYHVASRLAGIAIHSAGDTVIVDLQALDPQGNPYPSPGGDLNRYTIVLGTGQAIPDLETAISAMPVGMDGRFLIRYPEDFPDPQRRGSQQVFRIKLHEVRKSDGSAHTPPLIG